MNYGRAFGAGVLGGLVMTILMALGRMMGMTTMNLEMALGSMLTQNLGSATWLMGFIMHLIISGLIALLYAAGFEYVTHRSNWLLGASFGAIHTVIAGVVMGMMGNIHPLMAPPPPPAGYLMAPGFFAANFGMMTALAFIMLHLIYGAIVGALYRVTAEHLHHPGVPSPA